MCVFFRRFNIRFRDVGEECERIRERAVYNVNFVARENLA